VRFGLLSDPQELKPQLDAAALFGFLLRGVEGIAAYEKEIADLLLLLISQWALAGPWRSQKNTENMLTSFQREIQVEEVAALLIREAFDHDPLEPLSSQRIVGNRQHLRDERTEQYGLFGGQTVASKIKTRAIAKVDALALNPHPVELLRRVLYSLQQLGDISLALHFCQFRFGNPFCNGKQRHGHDNEKQHHQCGHQVREGNPERLLCLLLRPPLDDNASAEHALSGSDSVKHLAQFVDSTTKGLGAAFYVLVKLTIDFIECADDLRPKMIMRTGEHI
jgi:hypothetical protein